MNMYGGSGGISSFLTSILDGRQWSVSRLCCFAPGETAPYTSYIGGCVSLRIGLDFMEERKTLLPLQGIEAPILSRPVRSLVARLSYPGSLADWDGNISLVIFLRYEVIYWRSPVIIFVGTDWGGTILTALSSRILRHDARKPE
jgi:hypothetical protein